ncbi:hypothetical protein GCM10008931_43900 [Oceanobacillus oncorhynchi subsp. oncorhynchi]|uniref:hypothetical protein n=1 Tax=Oceanobacillus oncorhynchi TaxID=545501 RepID=UPI0031D198F6
MKTIEINYPDNFFNFSNGVDVSNEDIETAIEEGMRELVDARRNDYYIWSTGNTQVLLTKNIDLNVINVTVSKNYKEDTIYL